MQIFAKLNKIKSSQDHYILQCRTCQWVYLPNKNSRLINNTCTVPVTCRNRYKLASIITNSRMNPLITKMISCKDYNDSSIVEKRAHMKSEASEKKIIRMYTLSSLRRCSINFVHSLATILPRSSCNHDFLRKAHRHGTLRHKTEFCCKQS